LIYRFGKLENVVAADLEKNQDHRVLQEFEVKGEGVPQHFEFFGVGEQTDGFSDYLPEAARAPRHLVGGPGGPASDSRLGMHPRQLPVRPDLVEINHDIQLLQSIPGKNIFFKHLQ
jgi:hypothetical protein